MSDHPKSFFQSFTGVITAIASLIVAITGLYAATDGFNFGSQTQQAEIVEPNNEQDHLIQIQNLKRQKEIDDLRIQQQKSNLLAQQEIAALKQQLQESTPQSTIELPYNQTNTPNVTINISGNWTLTNQIGTYVFAIQQNGNQLSLQEFDSFNNNVGTGTGSINGKNVELYWTEPYLFVATIDISAQLSLNANNTILDGTMYTEDNQAPIRLYRQ